MAFRRVQSKDVRPKLLQPSDLGRIPAVRLADERQYWEGKKENADFLRLTLAEFMLDHVIPRAEQPFQDVGVAIMVTEQGRIGMGRVGFDTSRYALSGLALSQLIRRTAMLDASQFGVSPEGPLIETHEPTQRVGIHASSVVVQGLLIPSYSPERPEGWFIDGTSAAQIVRTPPEEFTTVTAFQDFQRQLPKGTQIDTANFVSVRPHLTREYLSRPH